MTGQEQTTIAEGAINTLLEHGLADGLPRIAEMLLNAAMLLERAAHLRARSHERTEARVGYANGFKPRGLQTSQGALELRLPQVRECEEPFRSSLLEIGSRIERSLKAAIAEMYLQGVSTRRVTAIMERLCGLEVTSCQVSRLTAELDAQFEKWRSRPLPPVIYLFLDATCIKVRLDGAVRDCAVLTAIGVCRQSPAAGRSRARQGRAVPGR